MKLKKFCVTYTLEIGFDTTIVARTREEAEQKVREVIGADARMGESWEITHA